MHKVVEAHVQSPFVPLYLYQISLCSLSCIQAKSSQATQPCTTSTISSLSLDAPRDSHRPNRLLLSKLLREQSLPDIEPLLLLRRGEFTRLLEGAGEEFAKAGAEDFEDQHGFPVGEGEAAAVAVEDDDAGEHLDGFGWLVDG